MKSLVIKFLAFFLGLGLLGAIVVGSVIFYFSASLPKISKLSDYQPSLPSKILAKDGTVLAEIGQEKRDVVAVKDIPPTIINAFLSAEDSNFYEHKGVDYTGVLRALVANIKAGRVVQGGSTITQQVAKSLLLTRERSISRKIKDFLLALKIEEKFNKEEILFLYLNQVYLGGGYYGVKSAARGYYNKELNEVTPAEAAMLAGLLVAPGRYSPYINPSRAVSRQHYVLKRLYENNHLSQEEYQNALNEKVKFYLRKSGEFKAGYFTDWVRQRVIEKIGEDEFLTGGYIIQTTLDWELQETAEKEVLKGVKGIDKRQGFKGPIQSLKPEDIQEFSFKERLKIYDDESDYFTIGPDFQKVYPFQEESKKDMMILEKDGFYLGNSKEDPLYSLLNQEIMYEAVVIDVDDSSKLVFVSLGGLVGVIPHEYFRWAHERIIEEQRTYTRSISRPSQILKEGDVIHVSLLNKDTSLEKVIDKDFRKTRRWESLRKKLSRESYLLLELDQEPEAQGALVSMDPFSGEIKSLVGGWSFSESQFNRALQSLRQPGSSFKPILFAAGLENGYNPASIIIDSPEALGGADESLNWKPSNYDGKFKGPITYRNSLEQSRNVPTIKIAEDIGVDTIIEFCKRIGFNAELDKDLSLALGSFGINLLDLVRTYAIFPNGGRKIEPKSILGVYDRHGLEINFKENEVDTLELVEDEEISDSREPKEDKKEEDVPSLSFTENLDGDRVYDRRLAYIMTNLLNGVVLHGTGRRALKVSSNLGGKTGTTNNYVDAWFIGFSPKIVTGVWTGFDENETLGWGETGSKSALPIWSAFMEKAISKFGDIEFTPPPGILHTKIDKETGKLDSSSNFTEAFVEGTEPGGDFHKKGEVFRPENQTEILEEDDYYSQ